MGMMLRGRVVVLVVELELVHQSGGAAVVRITGFDCVSLLVWVVVLCVLAYHGVGGLRVARLSS